MLRIADWVHALRRRFWIIALSVLLIAPLSVAVAYFLPAKYQATTLIQVESQQIRADLVSTIVTTSAAERLRIIQQRLMTRENLLALIERVGLYANRPDLSPTEKVDLVRENTNIESITFERTTRGPAPLAAFILTFTAESGPLAARAANEFAETIVRQNVQTRTSQAENTLGFLRSEVDRLSAALLGLEKEITAYKKDNEMALPEGLDFWRQELSALRLQMFERETKRLTLEEERRALMKALEAGTFASLSSEPESQDERDLQNLRRTLLQRRAFLSEVHPEIVALKARIAALEAVLAPAAAAEGEDPAVARTRAELAMLEKQLALLAEQREADRQRQKVLEAALTAGPQVEMALNVYDRRYGQLQAQYEIAVKKLAEASSGEKLETNQQAERFTIIEPAQIPERPAWPNRLLIAAGGGVASLAVGLGLAVLLEILNPAIRTAHALEHLLGLRPIVSVPYVMTARERALRRVLWRLLLVGVFVVMPAALYLVDRYYMPLGTVLEALMEKTGIENVLRLIEARLER